MRQLVEIKTEIESLGRPFLACIADATKREKVAAIRERQLAWALSDPARADRWRRLCLEAETTAAAEDAQRIAVAESKRLLERLAATVGDVALEAIPRALREPRDGMRAAVAFVDSPAWSLTMLGGVGTGKTVPAAWLAKRTLEAGETLTWWRAPSMARQGVFGVEADQRTKRACNATLLVLDDLGAELPTGPWIAVLNDVLGYRHAHGAKTVVTGNLSLEELRKLLGDRLYDRLCEGVVVGTGKGSMRRRLPAPEAHP